ncbi:metal ABC transporter permease [Halofilum ochraceum]|uniref:metal ABC transporter permease n=1 Tax=Halofilum ochraceum TaxID=1611323 RepID=UPI0009F60580|nr:metal ABC transporter permease [Halofilum ochraceum]
MAAFFGNPTLMIILTGALVGISGALLGTFLILRRNAMLVDAISHSIVFGIVVVWLITWATSGPVQILGAALAGLLTVFLTELLANTRRVRMDAAIGLVFPALFAAGVLLLNIYARDVHLDTHTVLLGEIGFVWLDTVTVAGIEIPRSVVWMGTLTLINAVFVIAFFKELKLSTFDPGLATALGLAPTAMFYALLTLTSATAVAAFDAVGAVLYIAFVIVPPAAAYLLTDRLIPMLVWAAAIGVISSATGYAAAIALDVSIGGMMALMTGACFGLAFLFGPRYGLVAQAWRQYMRRYADESRALVVHLYEHEGNPEAARENVVPALQKHLGWDPAKAEQVLRRSLRRGLVLREGTGLHLTRRGRQAARELLEY